MLSIMLPHSSSGFVLFSITLESLNRVNRTVFFVFPLSIHLINQLCFYPHWKRNNVCCQCDLYFCLLWTMQQMFFRYCRFKHCRFLSHRGYVLTTTEKVYTFYAGFPFRYCKSNFLHEECEKTNYLNKFRCTLTMF